LTFEVNFYDWNHPKSSPRPRREATVVQAFTAALWLTWALIGVLGLWLQHVQRPINPPPREPPPIKVETVNVDLTPDLQPAAGFGFRAAGHAAG